MLSNGLRKIAAEIEDGPHLAGRDPASLSHEERVELLAWTFVRWARGRHRGEAPAPAPSAPMTADRAERDRRASEVLNSRASREAQERARMILAREGIEWSGL